MRTLNKAAAEAIASVDGVHACTDITGFGLAGHASEMAAGSNVTIEIDAKALPIIPGVLEIASQEQVGRDEHQQGTLRGRELNSGREVSDDLSGRCIFDPQTSGGLLISVARRVGG